MNTDSKRHISYPGICATYGAGKSMLTGYLAPGLVQIALNIATSQPPLDANFSTAVTAGIWGFAAGAFAHIAANKYASRREMGITRGGNLVKKWQAAAYAVPVALGLAAINIGNDNIADAMPSLEPAASHIQFQQAPKILPLTGQVFAPR